MNKPDFKRGDRVRFSKSYITQPVRERDRMIRADKRGAFLHWRHGVNVVVQWDDYSQPCGYGMACIVKIDQQPEEGEGV